MSRRPIIAGNWKMYKTVKEAVSLAGEIASATLGLEDRDIVIAPPFTALADVGRILKKHVALAAQNVSWENEGAYTGEVSPIMLNDVGCEYVIIGHSERRHIFGEPDEMISRKLKAALREGLRPIFCIGEKLEEREAGRTWGVLEDQMRKGLRGVAAEDMDRIVVAYEPVWAIGTGKTATDEQAEAAHVFVRGLVERTFDKKIARDLRILYGGSVKPDNVDGLMSQPNIDGVLVGGASLQAVSFLRIVNFVRQSSI